jgi:hypothetical protein
MTSSTSKETSGGPRSFSQDYHPLSHVLINQSQPNNSKSSSRCAQQEKRLFNRQCSSKSQQQMYYTTILDTPSSLTKQHMDKASQLSSKSNNKNNTSLTFMVTAAPQVTLPYTIHNYSSFSGSYHPQNITVNNPKEQASRWSSGVHDSEQFITISFELPVIARKVFISRGVFLFNFYFVFNKMVILLFFLIREYYIR